jgi:hypothetical protein
MIEVLADFPDAVLAVKAGERVTADDYRDVLTPAVEDRLSRHAKLRLLYVLGPEFRRFTTTALWDDGRLGFHHLQDFDRIAVVTDVDWLARLARQSAKTLRLEICHYPNAELPAARNWICEGLA